MSSLSSAAAPPRAAGPPMRVSRLGDELLARYAAHGNERAFAALYERYHQQLYRYCRSILRNDADSQDALQSTFTGALQALRRDQRNAPLRPWLYRIAHNESISLLRRRARTDADELTPESMGTGGSVEQEAADRARWQSLVEDLGSLPDRQRGALLLRELSGLSHEEIAIALGTTAAAAKQAIFEARQALGELEEGRAMSCEEVRRRLSDGDRRVMRGRRVRSHLRECAACGAFAVAIPERREQLRAFAPVLAPATAAAVLSRSVHAASSHGGAGGSSAGAAGAGATAKTMGTAMLWKGLAGVAVLATAAAGVTGVRHLLSSSPTADRTPSAQHGSPHGHAYGRRGTHQHGSGRFGAAGDRAGSGSTSHAGAHGRSAAGAGGRPGAAKSNSGTQGGAAGTSSQHGAVGTAPPGSSGSTGSSGSGGSQRGGSGGGAQGGGGQGQGDNSQGGGSGGGSQGGGSASGGSQGGGSGGGAQGGGGAGGAQGGGGQGQGGNSQGGGSGGGVQNGTQGQGGNSQGGGSSGGSQGGSGGSGGSGGGGQGGNSQGGNTQGGNTQGSGGGTQGGNSQGGNTQGSGGTQGGNSQGGSGGGSRGGQGGGGQGGGGQR